MTFNDLGLPVLTLDLSAKTCRAQDFRNHGIANGLWNWPIKTELGR